MPVIHHDGVELAFEVEGDPDGAPVLLLHGFPDTSRVWIHQRRALVEAGRLVITPDMRGFGASGRPEAIESYRMSALVGDAIAILTAVERSRVDVVGHDLGAVLGWALASRVPAVVERLVAISVGYSQGFAELDLEQWQRWWYMLLFQPSGLAETFLPLDDWRGLRLLARDHPAIDDCIADLSAPGALTAALGWYRANTPPEAWVAPFEGPPVLAPTMGIWSTGDVALTEAQMTSSAAHVEGPWRYERIEGPGHWLPLEAPGVVNDLLLDFLA
ncbi:MAG: alpha/beta fold hydrolase [Acidimicrobiales bacterium]